MRRHATWMILLGGLALGACLPNPEGPVLEPPGEPPSEYVSNFNSIQINGDFSGVNWELTDPRHYLKLEADYRWAIWVSVLATDYTDGEIHFKFTHDASWSPDNFGAGSNPGDLILDSGDPPHCIIEMDGPPGFYKVWMDDNALRDSSELALATGSIDGTRVFDGPEPPTASAQLKALNDDGDATLWSVDATGGGFTFENLADSLYSVTVTATGYGSATREVRVSGGHAASLQVDLGEPLSSVTPDEPYYTPVIDGLRDAGWTYVYDDDGHVGQYNVVHMDYDSLFTAQDADSFYLAAAGDFSGTFNSLSLFIDADYGAGSGVTDLSTITGAEEYQTVVNRLKKDVDFSAVPDFGAEFATSTWGQLEPRLTALAEDGMATALGRGAIAVSSTWIELAIPWSVLYPELGGEGAVPPLSQVAVFAIIGSTSLIAFSDDTLPLVADKFNPTAVIAVPVDEDGR